LLSFLYNFIFLKHFFKPNFKEFIMKKLIALFALVVLSTVIVLAADPAPASNNFKFSVICPAAYIDHTAQDIQIGDYNLNNSPVFTPSNAVGTWNVYGDPSKTFTVTYTKPDYNSIPGFQKIAETWTIAGFDDAAFLPGTYPITDMTGFKDSPYYNVSLAGTACSQGHGVVTLTIVDLTLDPTKVVSGPYTLTYTFAITAF
jgi:hypothetical protein